MAPFLFVFKGFILIIKKVANRLQIHENEEK
jgi:hypothetical protein